MEGEKRWINGPEVTIVTSRLNSMLDIIEKTYDLKRGPVGGWVVHVVETPAFRFTNYLKYLESSSRVLHVPVKDMHNIDDVICMLGRIERLVRLPGKDDFISGELSDTRGSEFDRFALLGRNYHRSYKHEDPSVHRVTALVFPYNHCEFSGLESPVEYNKMLDETITPADWNRKIVPKVRFLHSNPKSGVATKGRNPILIALSDLIYYVQDQFGVEGAWTKLRNYLDQDVTIRSLPDYYEVTDDTSAAVSLLSKSDIRPFIDSFFQRAA